MPGISHRGRAREFAYLCSLEMSHEKFRKLSKESGVFSDVSMDFQEKIMERSGLGDCTHLPQGSWP